MLTNGIELKKKHDLAILKALKRTIKDAIYFLGEDIKPISNIELVKLCQNSRERHPHESLWENYMFWFTDSTCKVLNEYIDLIWISRVMNIIGEENIPKNMSHRLKHRISTLCYIFRESDKKYINKVNLIKDNIDIIRKVVAFKDVGLTDKHMDVFCNLICLDRSNLPL